LPTKTGPGGAGKSNIVSSMRSALQVVPRAFCRDLEPDCFKLVFCEAWCCAVDLRRGLTGELTHCPLCGIDAVVHYPDRDRPKRPWRRAA
jgi:hypothetical protein